MQSPSEGRQLDNGTPGIHLEDDTAADHDVAAFESMDPDTFQDMLLPLLTCPLCGNVLVDPVTLQCGNTLCRTCLPGPLENRAPAEPGEIGIHGRSGCPYFWTLGSRVAGVDIERQGQAHRRTQNEGGAGGGGTTTSAERNEKWIPPTMRERFECPFGCSRTYHSRSVSSNFTLQKALDVIPSFSTPPAYSEKPAKNPAPIALATNLHAELDCQICYLLLHDPLTTPCGHTFCRPCLLRTSDHATHPVCPTCRSPVLLPTPSNTPTNILIDTLICTLFPTAAAERASCETAERHSFSSSGVDTPIFVCTLALPSVTCFLHIFEPRYRLMLRRCMAGDRKFGMVLPRSRVGIRYLQEAMEMQYVNAPDGGELPTGSRATFMRYGTMLEIREMQMLPDGRSLVETVGRERFAIEQWSVRDGYIVAKTHVLPDIEPTVYTPPTTASTLTSAMLVEGRGVDALTTRELIYLTRRFVQSLRHVAWTPAARVRDNEVDRALARLDEGGDAVKFAWWVGSKIPVEEVEGYSLLLQGGVRELYCVIGRWIGEMESQSW